MWSALSYEYVVATPTRVRFSLLPTIVMRVARCGTPVVDRPQTLQVVEPRAIVTGSLPNDMPSRTLRCAQLTAGNCAPRSTARQCCSLAVKPQQAVCQQRSVRGWKGTAIESE